MDESLAMEEGAGDGLGTIVSGDDGGLLHKHLVDLVL
jgi:hypothetical protein